MTIQETSWYSHYVVLLQTVAQAGFFVFNFVNLSEMLVLIVEVF